MLVQQGKVIVIQMIQYVGHEERRGHVTTWHEDDLVEIKGACSKKMRDKKKVKTYQ